MVLFPKQSPEEPTTNHDASTQSKSHRARAPIAAVAHQVRAPCSPAWLDGPWAAPSVPGPSELRRASSRRVEWGQIRRVLSFWGGGLAWRHTKQIETRSAHLQKPGAQIQFLTLCGQKMETYPIITSNSIKLIQIPSRLVLLVMVKGALFGGRTAPYVLYVGVQLFHLAFSCCRTDACHTCGPVT